jgi:hypothetical protein
VLSFARKNQKLIAERTGWPKGALLTCWRLERLYPGWHVSWLGENRCPGFERPAGFWATNLVDPFHQVEAFREDPAELEELLAEGVPAHDYSVRGCSWCVIHASDFGRVRL